MKPPAIYAVVALDAFGEVVLSVLCESEKVAAAELESRRGNRELTDPRATTFHVAKFSGEWVEP